MECTGTVLHIVLFDVFKRCAETVKQVQAKNRKCGYTNKAQTITVWAFSKFAMRK